MGSGKYQRKSLKGFTRWKGILKTAQGHKDIVYESNKCSALSSSGFDTRNQKPF